MSLADTAVERGGVNVFADHVLPDSDAHVVKAELVSRINDIVHRRDITQAKARRMLGLSQPDVSRLLRLLTILGRDMDIAIRLSRSSVGGRLRVAAADSA